MNLDLDQAVRHASQEALSALFVDRLRTAMHDNGISAATLARRTGLSKAAISQLLSNRKARLPNSFTIYCLARALNRNVDYFLGTTAPLAGERATFAIELYQNGFMNAERLWRETVFSGNDRVFTLVCDTLPDFLKTEAVLACEHGTSAEVADHGARMAHMREAHGATPARGLVLCETSIVYQLVKGIGLYRTLSEADRNAQIGIMNRYFDAHFPDLTCTLVSYRQNKLSPVVMYDHAVLVAPMFGWHMQITHAAMFREMSDAALNASRKGVPLRQYIELVADL